MATRTLTEQAERVCLLIDGAPPEACPDDLGDLDVEVNLLVHMVLSPAPVAPTKSFSFELAPKEDLVSGTAEPEPEPAPEPAPEPVAAAAPAAPAPEPAAQEPEASA